MVCGSAPEGLVLAREVGLSRGGAGVGGSAFGAVLGGRLAPVLREGQGLRC
ncbi:hypothetical protein GCM10017786_32380 [Amycolatopsis deserti]|uniref:Uncharacterized protein n=1 Tax=Amycolatopsis deserti TaxID=185696 RepID=A0ABQ3J0K9_9PSEU|nr:hypothetical protein GCM10017786_32380 [Amycolatopsis deserti]